MKRFARGIYARSYTLVGNIIYILRRESQCRQKLLHSHLDTRESESFGQPKYSTLLSNYLTVYGVEVKDDFYQRETTPFFL